MISDKDVKRLSGKHCTINQAAEISGCSYRTVYRAIKSRKLVAYKVGQSLTIYISDLDAWLSSKVIGSRKPTIRRIGRDVHGPLNMEVTL